VDIRQVLTWTTAAAEVLALGRVCLARLYARYPCFTAYLGVDCARTVAAYGFRLVPSDTIYQLIWTSTEPVLLIVQILVCWELYSRVCDHYRHFRALRGRLLAVSGLVALLFCSLSLRRGIPSVEGQSLAVYEAFIARYTTFLLASFLGAAALFFAHFRVPIRRNVLMHGWLLAPYYVSTAVYAIAIQSHANKYASDCLFMGVHTIIFLGWATLLTRRGETVEVWPEVSKAEYDATTAAKEKLLRIAREL
jgi:hypothetical protein